MSIDPEDRYPHRFDELWPKTDRIAYLSDPNIWTRAWLVDEIGRLLEDDDVDGEQLNSAQRLSMTLLARILVDLRDQRRAIRILDQRLEECQKDVTVLEDRLQRHRDDND